MSAKGYVLFRGEKITIVNPEEWWYVTPSKGSLWLFSFPCGTRLLVWEGNLSDALEHAAEWLAEHAPGLITTEEELWKDEGAVKDAMKAVGVSGPFGDLDEEDQARVYDNLTADLTRTESGYIHSWEWHVNDLDLGEVYKAALVDSVREDPEGLDDTMIESYVEALALIRSAMSERTARTLRSLERVR